MWGGVPPVGERSHKPARRAMQSAHLILGYHTTPKHHRDTAAGSWYAAPCKEGNPCPVTFRAILSHSQPNVPPGTVVIYEHGKHSHGPVRDAQSPFAPAADIALSRAGRRLPRNGSQSETRWPPSHSQVSPSASTLKAGRSKTGFVERTSGAAPIPAQAARSRPQC